MQAQFLAGLKTEVTDNVHFLDEQKVIYPAGHNVVVFHIEDKTQQYLPGIEGSEGITAMAISQSRKFFAVAERTEKTPIVSIYEHVLQ